MIIKLSRVLFFLIFVVKTKITSNTKLFFISICECFAYAYRSKERLVSYPQILCIYVLCTCLQVSYLYKRVMVVVATNYSRLSKFVYIKFYGGKKESSKEESSEEEDSCKEEVT